MNRRYDCTAHVLGYRLIKNLNNSRNVFLSAVQFSPATAMFFDFYRMRSVFHINYHPGSGVLASYMQLAHEAQVSG